MPAATATRPQATRDGSPIDLDHQAAAVTGDERWQPIDPHHPRLIEASLKINLHFASQTLVLGSETVFWVRAGGRC